MPKTRKRTARRPELTFKSRGKEIKNVRVTKRLTESYPQTKKASQESKKLDEADDVKGQVEESIIENNFDDEDHSLQGPEPVIQVSSDENSVEQVKEEKPEVHHYTHYCDLKELENPNECGKEDVVAYLRQFDLALDYGPYSNITRMERFERAVKLGLAPPQSVKFLIDKFKEQDPDTAHSFLHSYSAIM